MVADTSPVDKSVMSCYQVLDLKSQELHVNCPRCKQVSSAPPDAVVACPTCDQQMYTQPTAGRFLAPVMASPKDVREIAGLMPYLSVYHIATALDEQNFNKRAAVLSLLAGKTTPETDAWLAAASDTVSPTDTPVVLAAPTPTAQVYYWQSRLGFDDSLGKWNADRQYTSNSAPRVATPKAVKRPKATKPPPPQPTCASKTIHYERRMRSMGFDNSLGLWNADSKYYV
uniref:CUE domain-containing protein n=1 Tax=Pyramimonas obovata TaxID=1411642 RepID=A0A7S0N9B0_9CHLO|mmetsp:Transcript_22153/g.48620  ORF Transcript_22153/g.48620 Transcript_22153/m.48620 type:complete len:228 (+) Transcript_22153:235-918(+)